MKLAHKAAIAATSMFLALGATVQARAADQYVSIGSCPIGCTAYTWSAGIAEVINKNVQGVQATAEETKGYVQNIKLMQGGDLEAAMATSLSAYDAYHASGNYEGTEPGQIMSWLSIAPVAMHVITRAESDIKTLDDLKGKRVGMGQPGGTSMLDADALMAYLGLEPDKDFEPFRVRLGNMADMLADKNLDAAMWNGSFPLPPLIKLVSQHDVRLIPVEDAVVEGLREKYPPYFRLSIPADTYKGVAGETPTYGLGNALVISKKIPEDIVYGMTKAIFEELEYLGGVHPAFKRVGKDSVLNGFGAPLHPGALKYYREIGVPGIEDFVKQTSQ